MNMLIAQTAAFNKCYTEHSYEWLQCSNSTALS